MGQVKQVDETTRRRELVDTEQLSDEFREAIEADDFLVYGKASVEQFDEDDPPQKLTMEALADALPQLYQDGIISRRHKDVPIGEVVPEWELDEPTEVQVGDDVHSFDAGDTLETHIDEDSEEFWIVANVYNRSEIAKDTRLRAMTGELDGFSVTISTRRSGTRPTTVRWSARSTGTPSRSVATTRSKTRTRDSASRITRHCSVRPPAHLLAEPVAFDSAYSKQW